MPEAAPTSATTAIAETKVPSPARPAAVTSRPPNQPKPAPRNVIFSVSAGHSREIVKGNIWLGVSYTSAGNRLEGWLWIAPARRTVWLRNTNTQQPIFFQAGHGTAELVVTRLTNNTITGYVVMPRS